MKFWVDFSGYACVEAKNAEHAEEVMWEAIHHNTFDSRTVFDDVWDIDGIEERVDEPLLKPVYGDDIDIMKILPAGHTPTQEEWENFWEDR